MIETLKIIGTNLSAFPYIHGAIQLCPGISCEFNEDLFPGQI